MYTDHKPLVDGITSRNERSPRQFRHMDFIAQFTTDIRHVHGHDNVVVDMLSRVGVDTLECAPIDTSNTPPWTLDNLIEAQRNDPELKQIRSSMFMKTVEVVPGSRVVCNTSTKSNRPYVPLASLYVVGYSTTMA